MTDSTASNTSREVRIVALVSEANDLSRRLAAITDELSLLAGEAEAARFERYRSPDFSKQLADHLHQAKRASLTEPSGVDASS
jgi:hypothetical protein